MSALVECSYCGAETLDIRNVTMVDLSDRYEQRDFEGMVKVCTCCGGTPNRPPMRPASKWSAPVSSQKKPNDWDERIERLREEAEADRLEEDEERARRGPRITYPVYEGES